MGASQQIMWALGAAAGGGSAPAFSAEIQRNIETASTATTVLTVASTIAAGQRIIIPVSWDSATQTVTSVTDSAGNTYGLIAGPIAIGGSNSQTAIYSANASTGLTGGVGTITITWGTPAFTFRAWAVFTILNTNTSNASVVDITKTATGTATTAVTASATTLTATTLCFAVIDAGAAVTISASNWTVSGAAQGWDGAASTLFYAYKATSSTGAQDPGGTLSAATNWACVWAAFKP